MSGADGVPSIGDYAFLSDCSSAALVSRAGSVDWWCLPRFDSPSVFARLLDPSGGHWVIAPVAEHRVERDYVKDSLVLRTMFATPTGTVALTDTLALEPGARGHEIGHRSPCVLLRAVEGLSGEVDMTIVVAPRLEYALTVPRWTYDDGTWALRAGPTGLRLRTAVGMESRDGDVSGNIRIRAGEAVAFSLAYDPPYSEAARLDLDTPAAIDETVAGWQSWSAMHRGYTGRHVDQVRRSALVLQGLTYQKTGAVVAAATTSLPEKVGGHANWDYRFAWLRDISLTLQALWVAACPHESDRFFDWLSGAIGMVGDKPLQIMYGVEGERDLTEHPLEHLAGYRDSAPVRVGNDAWSQRQLDVLGEVLFAAYLLRDQIGDFDPATQELLVTLADQAVRDWSEPDAGMWESRGQPRHYTSSKVMCWVALDRAIALADRLGDGADVARWSEARDEIHAAVLEEACSD